MHCTRKYVNESPTNEASSGIVIVAKGENFIYLFVVYLTTLSQQLRLYRVKVLSRNLPGATEENHENVSQKILFPGRDLDTGPLEIEAGMLTTHECVELFLKT
jgi:hypothetical protein